MEKWVILVLIGNKARGEGGCIESSQGKMGGNGGKRREMGGKVWEITLKRGC